MSANVLLVDDEAINLMALKSALRREYHVFTALNAEEALTILQSHTMMAIVSDQKMPGICGTDFLAICQQKGYPGLRIIVSGYDDDAAIKNAYQSGLVNAILGKPLRLPQLTALLARQAPSR